MFNQLKLVREHAGAKWVDSSEDHQIIAIEAFSKDRHDALHLLFDSRNRLALFVSSSRIGKQIRLLFGIPLRSRAGTNPGGPGHDWVFRRFGAWLDPESPVKAAPGEVLYFLQQDDVDVAVPRGTPKAISRCFVPAKVEDNPHVNEEYVDDLARLDPVTRAQLRDGDWLSRPAAGLYFKRRWFEIVGDAPAQALRVRFWDRAATEGGGDWTAGVLMSRTTDGTIWVEDVVRLQGSPGRVKSTILQTAEIDGPEVVVALSEDPGAAGKFEAEEYARELQGFEVQFLRETDDKITRAGPFSSQCERCLVRIVRGDWNLKYLSELEAFPEGENDDQVDASSGAFTKLVETATKAAPFSGAARIKSRRGR